MLELKPVSYFSGHGWAFQAETSHLFTLTDGNPLDNTWDQIWFSAKFTGPAYVPGSTKDNAVYVDMVVAVRNQPDPDFQPVKKYTLDDRKQWKKFGSCQEAPARQGRGRNGMARDHRK